MAIGNFFFIVSISCLQSSLQSFVLFEFLEFGNLEEFSTDVQKKKEMGLIFWRIIMNFLGSSVCIYTNNKIGRKKSLLLTNVMMLITITSVYFSKETETILLILSATIGMATSAAPVYIYEASPTNLRSFVFFIYGSSSTLGIFMNYTCNIFFSKVIYCLLSFSFSFCFFVFLFFCLIKIILIHFLFRIQLLGL